MKTILFIVGISLLSSTPGLCRGKFQIQPKGYIESTVFGKNQGKMTGHVTGWFRMQEKNDQGQWSETDMVTWYIAQQENGLVFIQTNCARPISLHYVLRDPKNKLRKKWQSTEALQRWEQSIDLQKFPDGDYTVDVLLPDGKLVSTMEFNKKSI